MLNYSSVTSVKKQFSISEVGTIEDAMDSVRYRAILLNGEITKGTAFDKTVVTNEYGFDTYDGSIKNIEFTIIREENKGRFNVPYLLTIKELDD